MEATTAGSAVQKELVRTCSAAQAAILARATGKYAQVGGRRLRLDLPAAALPIDPGSVTRYLVRVEVVDEVDVKASAPAEATHVLSDLFGPYLA
jgi:hypothetical protein